MYGRPKRGSLPYGFPQAMYMTLLRLLFDEMIAHLLHTPGKPSIPTTLTTHTASLVVRNVG